MSPTQNLGVSAPEPKPHRQTIGNESPKGREVKKNLFPAVAVGLCREHRSGEQEHNSRYGKNSVIPKVGKPAVYHQPLREVQQKVNVNNGVCKVVQRPEK